MDLYEYKYYFSIYSSPSTIDFIHQVYPGSLCNCWILIYYVISIDDYTLLKKFLYDYEYNDVVTGYILK